MDKQVDVLNDPKLLDPMRIFSKGFWITTAILLAFMGIGFYYYIHQVQTGLGNTGLNRPIFWGFYITNFVFFIGISHAGTLISAILRMTREEWRRPITRAAEVITVMVLFFGAGSIIADMGRPDRLLNIFKHGSLHSPLIWDVISISIYLMGSIVYLLLPLIPDIAFLRDNLKVGKFRTWLYRVFSFGWKGTELQKKRLNKAIGIMAILIIPIAVSVHTVVSFVFSMTVQPMWHSTIFGPYFVVGAIFSGIAALIIAMALIRKYYNLGDYLRVIHFNNLGSLLLVMTVLWFYFTFAEYITAYYGAEPAHMEVFWSKMVGPYKYHFWTMFVTCFVIPFPILANPRTRTILGTVIASSSICIGMWLERFTIVVPTLENPRLPYEVSTYIPTMTEISITVGCFAGFIFCYLIFTKFFPIISIWEMKEGLEEGAVDAVKRIKSYYKGDVKLYDEEEHG